MSADAAGIRELKPIKKQRQRVSVADVIETAVAHHQRGHLDKAEELYRKLLEISPNDTNVLHFHGVLLHQRGRSDEAIDSIQRALQLDSKYLDAHNNLGNIFKETGRLPEAAEAYRRVLALDDSNAAAHNNLGATLRRLEQFEDSIIEYRRALELDGDNADIWANLGNALQDNDQVHEALTAFRKAIEIKPLHAKSHLGLARALRFVGRDEEAAAVYRIWLEREPTNPVAKHMLAAVTGLGVPDRASDEYIQKTFDGFADDFDSKLDYLGYRAPGLISAALDNELGPARASRDILDAGCGTGLCGPLVHEHAQRLVGVDLSKRMLAKAEHLGIYDDLRHAELTGFMTGSADRYDVVISADTLIYFGGLEPVFEAAALALRPGGCLIFSVEDAGNHPDGFVLNGHGRYSHTRDYIRQALEGAGMSVSRIESEVLRREWKRDVAGLVVTARVRQSAVEG